MIYTYSIKNFYSIGDKVDVNFTVGKQAPQTAGYVNGINEDRISLVEMVVGPNASGKTNVLKGLSFFKHLITESYMNNPKEDILVVPFMNSEESTEMDVTFSIENRLFNYYFELKPERILKETLREQTLTKERKTFKTLFNREWIEDEKEYRFTNSLPELNSIKLRKNASVVSTASLQTDDFSDTANRIFLYWNEGVHTNIWEKGHRGDRDIHHEATASNVIKYFMENPVISERIKSLLAGYDLGFKDFVEESSSIEKGLKTYGIQHRYGDRVMSVPLPYESSGTLRLLSILRVALRALSEPEGLAVIDEIDAYLHPDIVEAIVGLFSSSEVNSNHTQLIFSSHTHRTMNDLGKYQITLVEKNTLGSTEVWRLDDVNGVKNADNFSLKYPTGSYGAVPKIDI